MQAKVFQGTSRGSREIRILIWVEKGFFYNGLKPKGTFTWPFYFSASNSLHSNLKLNCWSSSQLLICNTENSQCCHSSQPLRTCKKEETAFLQYPHPSFFRYVISAVSNQINVHTVQLFINKKLKFFFLSFWQPLVLILHVQTNAFVCCGHNWCSIPVNHSMDTYIHRDKCQPLINNRNPNPFDRGKKTWENKLSYFILNITKNMNEK